MMTMMHRPVRLILKKGGKLLMLSQAFSLWRKALRSGAVWSAVVWNAVFSLLFMLVTDLANPSISSLLFPQADSRQELQMFHPHLLVLRNLFVVIAAVAVGPWVFSGVYGLLGQVAAGASVSWRSFGRLARKSYGRLWGLLLFLWIWMLALGLVSLVVLTILHGFGFLIVGILGILSVPGFIRMSGGLFVSRLSWTDSFDNVFTRAGYSLLLMGTVLGLLGCLILSAIGVALAETPVGFAPYYLILVVLSVTVPLWFFVLYQVSAPLNPHGWVHNVTKYG